MSTRPTLTLPPRFAIETATLHGTPDRQAQDEDAFVEAFEMALALQHQGGYAPADADKIAKDVYAVMAEGMWFVARAAEGEANAGEVLGFLALEEIAFRYSQTTFLQDAGFYVRPEYRRGRVGVALLARAREEGERRGKIVLIVITSPDRKGGAGGGAKGRTQSGLVAQMAGFVPMGYVLRLR